MYPPEFLAWRNMVYRCTDPYHRCYPKYGGAGVRVHEPWLEYTAFRRDMGSRPDGYVLARRDRKGDFTPDNCYWESRSRTRRLQASSIKLTYQGETRLLSDWAERTGISGQKIRMRLVIGWPVGQALGLEPRRPAALQAAGARAQDGFSPRP